VTAPLVVVMGVSGSGKSTIGALLADRLDCGFIDGDALHPASNRAKMASGVPLTDDDRRPWLSVVGTTLERYADTGVVIACSALRRVYREAIVNEAPGALFVHLAGAPDLLSMRLAARAGHFMPPSLLVSQIDTLEPLAGDEHGFAVSIADSPGVIADRIVSELRSTTTVESTRREDASSCSAVRR
jgi:gluconokinase